jgi:DNA-directed RNA polymerase specialized sigma24 family protein
MKDQPLEAVLGDHEGDLPLTDDGADPGKAVELDEEILRMLVALDKLEPEQDRNLVTLRFLWGQTYEQILEHPDLPVGSGTLTALRQRCHRALERLRELLGGGS